MSDKSKPRVTGLGGVFFKTANKDTVCNWYRDRLGIDVQDWGGTAFRWREEENADNIGYTVWSSFEEKSDYFAPSDAPFMLNFRVADMDALLPALKDEGVTVVKGPVDEPNGKFAWIMDPEGRKVELWEPVPSKDDPYL